MASWQHCKCFFYHPKAIQRMTLFKTCFNVHQCCKTWYTPVQALPLQVTVLPVCIVQLLSCRSHFLQRQQVCATHQQNQTGLCMLQVPASLVVPWHVTGLHPLIRSINSASRQAGCMSPAGRPRLPRMCCSSCPTSDTSQPDMQRIQRTHCTQPTTHALSAAA